MTLPKSAVKGMPAPKKALSQLYELMQDRDNTVRVRLSSAISASRVEPLAMPGETPPPAVAWLRQIMEWKNSKGEPLRAEWRREAGAALSYYERRALKAQLTYQVADVSVRREDWRTILNAVLRRRLWSDNRWPAERHRLFGPAELDEVPPHDPELAMIALTLPVERRAKRARRKIDEPLAVGIESEEERVAILAAIAQVVQKRLDVSGQ